MKLIFGIFLVVYYLFGTLCLPSGDFSVMQDLPEMYRNCKATEDKDMTLFDFVTDHLINIDCIFDKHENGDEQKPHTPIQFHHSQNSTIFVAQQFEILISSPITTSVNLIQFSENFYISDYISKIFRPPIV